VVPTSLGGNLYEADIPAASCGTVVQYYVSARTTTGVTWTDPPAGPTQVHSSLAASYVANGFTDDMEVDLGWTVGAPGDDATTGIWERVNPNGTGAQPENDHSDAPGTQCWVTGQGSVGGSSGENDVDDGTTTLISPNMDATGLADPFLSYWRWYSNNAGGNPGQDTLVIDISSNGGGSWVSLEVVGPTGFDSIGGWIQHRVRIADFVTPTNQIRLRLIASDLGGGSVVEAAIDDISIDDLTCAVGITNVNPPSGSTNGRTVVTVTGEGFVPGVTTVSFGENPSPDVSVTSDTQLTAVVPRRSGSAGAGRLGHAPQAVDVRVTTGVGTAVLPRAFTYVLPVK